MVVDTLNFILYLRVPIVTFPHQSLIQTEQNSTNENELFSFRTTPSIREATAVHFPSLRVLPELQLKNPETYRRQSALTLLSKKTKNRNQLESLSAGTLNLKKIFNFTYIRDAYIQA